METENALRTEVQIMEVITLVAILSIATVLLIIF